MLCINFADAYKLYDIMGDGILTPDQVKQAMLRVGTDVEDDEFIRMLNKVDPEGLALFTFQKFIDLMTHFRHPPLTEPEVAECFELIDMDGSGSIDCGELKKLLTCMGHALSQEDAEAMIDEADKDCSGDVDYQEFCHVILSTQ